MTGASMEAAVARLCFPHGDPGGVITSGGTESTLLGLLLAKKDAAGAPVRVVCTRGSRPSVARVAAQLGLPTPLVLDSLDGLADVLATLTTPTAVIATAGTIDTGAIEPLRAAARVCRMRGTWVHIDAGEAGVALFSDRLRPVLDGIELADSVALDFPELSAGLLAVRAAELLAHVRPPASPGVSATFRAHRHRLARDFEERCDLAADLADAICDRRNPVLWRRPALSTVVFRPASGLAEVYARMVSAGFPVERTRAEGGEWLKIAVPAGLNVASLLDLTGPPLTVGDGPHSE
ncbi:pyridoxal-dependent decarboxylase [Actinocrispum sp. NPDC049592]|uniref:pyridoxal-dependent decarboxylase n=1 Tax=Actinocrispum sp. NPDC049592 TaxID=3154835 RepID=UPI0034438332